MLVERAVVMANHRPLLTEDQLVDLDEPVPITHLTLPSRQLLADDLAIGLLVVDHRHGRLPVVLQDADHLGAGDLDVLIRLVREAELAAHEWRSQRPDVTLVVLDVDRVTLNLRHLTRVMAGPDTPNVYLVNIAAVSRLFNGCHNSSFGYDGNIHRGE